MTRGLAISRSEELEVCWRGSSTDTETLHDIVHIDDVDSCKSLIGRMTAIGRKPKSELRNSGTESVPLPACGFNRLMQHLTSDSREEDVADEKISKKTSPHRNGKIDDVGSLATG
jgi:hypothetical protein